MVYVVYYIKIYLYKEEISKLILRSETKMSFEIPKSDETTDEKVTPKENNTDVTDKKNTPKQNSGKGDKLRPHSVSQAEFNRKWEKAFGKKEIKDEKKGKLSKEEIARIINITENVPSTLHNKIQLLNDKTLEYELERLKTGHA